ncbi:MAG: ATP-binding protein [Acidobacteriota bacterium]|nr:ATP-binding protein [Blastocatellia bacterium]MDW8411736.1 ATP-binding protein [Acidobacteriota bacterium]
MLKLNHQVLICGFDTEQEDALRQALPPQAAATAVDLERLESTLQDSKFSLIIVGSLDDQILRRLRTTAPNSLVICKGDADESVFATFSDAKSKSTKQLIQRALEYFELRRENLVLQQDWHQVSNEIEAVFGFVRSADSTREVSLILDKLTAALCRSFSYNACAIELVDKNSWELYIKAAYGFPSEARNCRLPIEGKGVVSFVARTGKLVKIDDVTKDERYVSVNPSTKSQVALPLRIGQEIIGVLSVESERLAGFSERDIFILNSFAEKVSGLVHQAHLFDLVARAKNEWESTFDAMADAVFIFDRKRRLRRINRAGTKLMQSSFDKLLGQYCCALFPEEEIKGCLAQRVFNEGRRIVDKQYLGKDNITALFTCEPIYNPQRQLIGCVTVVRNEMDTARGEAETRSQRDMLATLLENSSASIIYLDSEGRIAWHNIRAMELCGCETGELKKMPFEMLAPEEYRPQLRRIISKLASTAANFETVLAHPQANKPVSITSTPILAEGKHIGTLLVVQQLINRTEKAMENDRMRALGQLSSGVAHDFNNILAAILGRAQLMQKRTSDPDFLKNLQVIERAARDGARMAKRILDFGKPRNSKENYAPVEIGELISEALAVTAPRWKDEANRIGRKIEVVFEKTSEIVVLGDGSELREVITNLIMNSIDAMPEGGKIEITYGTEGKTCFISVADTGTGIPKEIKDSIFDPFFTTKGEQGTGLGLHMVQNIVLDHGGSIRVDSEVGVGTTMRITLPLAHTPTGPQRLRQLLHEEQPTTRILVVDDEADVLELLTDILSSFGHEVKAAPSPEAALELIVQQPFDLLVTDLGMPQMNGVQLARRARQIRPEVRVILCTGWGEETDILEGVVDTIIGKPFELENIAAALRAVLTGQKQ